MKCHYCDKRIWKWQDNYETEQIFELRTDRNTILKKRRYYHMKCFEEKISLTTSMEDLK